MVGCPGGKQLDYAGAQGLRDERRGKHFIEFEDVKQNLGQLRLLMVFNGFNYYLCTVKN